MQEHRQEQEGMKTYPCRQCTQEFTKPIFLKEHMKQHYRIKYVYVWAMEFVFSDQWSWHMNCNCSSGTFNDVQKHVIVSMSAKHFVYFCFTCVCITFWNFNVNNWNFNVNNGVMEFWIPLVIVRNEEWECN